MNENGPTAAQREAVESNASRILVIAGPGSGKTRTMIWRIQRLIANGCEPSEIVAITFTNAAAKEIAERLATPPAIVGASSPEAKARAESWMKLHAPRLGYVGTLHGYALRELQRHGKVLGYGARLTVLDAEQADELLLRVGKDMGSKASAAKLQAARDGWKHGIRPSTAEELTVAAFYKRMRETGTIDFDTILRDFLTLLQTPPHEAGACVHLFVDEFQDAGTIDARIYDAMFARNRWIAGDPDQAIYGFRGGDVRGVLTLASDTGETHHLRAGATVVRTGWHTIKLEGNFRCAEGICAAANRLIENNVARVYKRTIPMRQERGRVEFWPPAPTDQSECERIVLHMAKLIADGAEPNELAIIARTNAIAMEAAKMCKVLGVPVREKKRVGLPEDWAFCRLTIDLMANPENAWIAEQWFHQYDPDAAAKYKRKAALEGKPITHYLHVEAGQFSEPRIDRLAEDLARMKLSAEAVEMVEAKLAEMVEPDFAQLAYALAAEIDHVPEVGRGVTVTTMHAAKGREWGTVAIIAAEDEITPGHRKAKFGEAPEIVAGMASESMAQQKRVEEERRVFFVAVTRAKDTLIVSRAENRREPWGRRQMAKATPSRFIKEILA